MDVDGTAIPFRKNSTPRSKVVEAIKKAKKFVRVSVSTGRPLFMARDIIKTLGVNAPCAVNDSTEIYDPVKNKILQTLYLDSKDTHAIKQIFEEKKMYFLINIGNREYEYQGDVLPKKYVPCVFLILQRRLLIFSLIRLPTVHPFLCKKFIPGLQDFFG